MQIILRGPAAGYEAEHTARIFFPGAEKAENLPETEDFVLAESHEMTDLILVRKDGRCLLYTSPSPRDRQKSRMPSSA